MASAAFLKALNEGRIRIAAKNRPVAIGTTSSILLRGNPKRCGYRFSHQSANRLHFSEDVQITNATGDEISRGTIVVETYAASAGGIGDAIQDPMHAAFETGAGTVYVTEYEVDI